MHCQNEYVTLIYFFVYYALVSPSGGGQRVFPA